MTDDRTRGGGSSGGGSSGGGSNRRRRRVPMPRLPELPRGTKGQQLTEILEDLVASCEPGAKLPSERELAQHHGVARMTARNAIDRLARQGLVHRVQGQGTFVSEPRLAQPSTLTSFSEDMAVRGMAASSIVLSQEVVPAAAPVALSLQLPQGEPVVRIERIRRGDGDPIALERTHLPARRFPDLEQRSLEDRSLYATLADDYDCEPATSEQRIAAVTLSDAEAHLLQAEPGAPALRIERVTRDRDGAPVEFVRSVYRGDRFELHTEQQRLRSVATEATPSGGSSPPDAASTGPAHGPGPSP